ncbi:glycosyltransferase family 4 protein [Erythrobacter sp.]|uniref:glycosyltransferase family 4 protein n=1 Tax=Erythrobacter sp. TaxID=1042 RepID=UPI0025E75E80|nr:glycosyltransferase family 4 protein [Erythrobacter sp.]
MLFNFGNRQHLNFCRYKVTDLANGVVEFWDFVLREPFGRNVSHLWESEQITLNWFVPPLSKHSGGHINLFRFMLGLEQRGFQIRVVIANDAMVNPCVATNVELLQNINDWYGPFNGGVYHDNDDIPPCHFAFATGWQSAYAVKAFRGALYRYYFVQDFEPYFYPVSSEYVFAEDTYRFGFTGITAGGWLADKLRTEYGMRTHAVGFSYDRNLYTPRARNSELRHLFCYVRPDTPRRAWDLTALTLAEFHKKRPDVGLVLAGGSIDIAALPFPAFAPGAVAQTELPDLYSQCDVALVPSLTNLSLLPLELMACGVPVVSNSGPNVEWLLNAGNASVMPANPRDLSDELVRILDLPPVEYGALRSRSMAFAASTDWERECDKVADILNVAVGRMTA